MDKNVIIGASTLIMYLIDLKYLFCECTDGMKIGMVSAQYPVYFIWNTPGTAGIIKNSTNVLRRTIMKWETPAYNDVRFGFEVTMYINNK